LAHAAAVKETEYVARVTADEGDRGRGFLDMYQDPESTFPVILTTSQLLTTGVDAPTCRNVVLFRTVGSMTEFKQIIGRGTRLREDHGKLFFNILDFTGSASKQFADPLFDGEPALVSQVEIDDAGNVTVVEEIADPVQNEEEDDCGRIVEGPAANPFRKLRVGGGPGGIVSVEVSDLAADGTKLRTANVRAFTGELVRGLALDAAALLARWRASDTRDEVLAELANHGIDLHALAAEVGTPAADAFDLLAHLAYNAPLRDRDDRARAVPAALFAAYAPPAVEVLRAILNKYAEHGASQFAPDVLQVPPLSAFGTVTEIAVRFGGVEGLLAAVEKLQAAVYAN
jgi:type I restriction enzyme R subunit